MSGGEDVKGAAALEVGGQHEAVGQQEAVGHAVSEASSEGMWAPEITEALDMIADVEENVSNLWKAIQAHDVMFKEQYGKQESLEAKMGRLVDSIRNRDAEMQKRIQALEEENAKMRQQNVRNDEECRMLLQKTRQLLQTQQENTTMEQGSTLDDRKQEDFGLTTERPPGVSNGAGPKADDRSMKKETIEPMAGNTQQTPTAGMKDWVKFNLKYSGRVEEDFDGFISQFEICCKLHQVPPSKYVMILELYVRDIAATYLREIFKSNPNSDYDTVKKLFRGKLYAGKGAEYTAMTISSMEQNSGETVRDYYERFRRVLAQSDLVEDSPFVLLYFRLGLRTRIQQAVLAVTAKSLVDIFHAATAVETGLASATSTVATNQGASYSRRGNCYTCGSSYHYARDCPENTCINSDNYGADAHADYDYFSDDYEEDCKGNYAIYDAMSFQVIEEQEVNSCSMPLQNADNSCDMKPQVDDRSCGVNTGQCIENTVLGTSNDFEFCMYDDLLTNNEFICRTNDDSLTDF